MEARIDKDEWMDVWNSNTELRYQVKALEAQMRDITSRVKALEGPATIYGKEVKRRE